MNHIRILSLVVVFIFLGTAGVVAGGNAHTLSLLPALSQNASPSLQHSEGYSIAYSHYTIRTNLSLASNNPLSQWSENSKGAYVISVPPGSDFSQYVQPTLTLQAEFDQNAVTGEAYASGTMSLQVNETAIFTPYTSLGVAQTPVLLAHPSKDRSLSTSSSGYGPQLSLTFGSINIEYNSTQAYGAMYGILSFSYNITMQQFSETNGGTMSVSHEFPDAVSGQEYVFPGTATLNTPNPQAVVVGNGNYTTISGTMNYGNYSLTINGPNGYSKTVSLGGSSRIGKPFSYQFVPTAVGNYTVTLTNSVVQLDYQNVFGVTATMPQPTVVVESSTASGYFTQGDVVNYTVTMNYQTSDPISFIINIWDGLANQHSVVSADQIAVNKEVKPSFNSSSGIFQYSGSFTVNSEGVSAGYITISASGYYFNAQTGQYLRSVNPGVATIQVSPHVSPAPVQSSSLIGYIEAALSLGAAGAAAYFDPDTPGAKFGIIGAGAILALVFMGVIP